MMFIFDHYFPITLISVTSWTVDKAINSSCVSWTELTTFLLCNLLQFLSVSRNLHWRWWIQFNVGATPTYLLAICSVSILLKLVYERLFCLTHLPTSKTVFISWCMLIFNRVHILAPLWLPHTLSLIAGYTVFSYSWLCFPFCVKDIL